MLLKTQILAGLVAAVPVRAVAPVRGQVLAELEPAERVLAELEPAAVELGVRAVVPVAVVAAVSSRLPKASLSFGTLVPS